VSSPNSASAPSLRGPDHLPAPFPEEQPRVTRFAPSPTGYLHLGHAYAALFAYEAARFAGGRFLLRLEDIDRHRCRPQFAEAILADLSWLGLAWDPPLRRQSEQLEVYAAALERLRELGVVYPCFCTHESMRREVEAAGFAPHGPEGEPPYPGICRRLGEAERARRLRRGGSYCWRLDVERALALTGRLRWFDCRAGEVEARPELLGDVVLGRKDHPVSYHLAVTVDDALQGVTLVTRGEDLFHATHIHRLLQALLGLPTPRYYHHNIVADSRGRRMAKRNRAVTLRHLRDQGRTPEEVWRLLGLGERHPQPASV